MAEAILSGIAVEIIQKLGSRVLQETRLWWGVKGELEKLRRTVSTIQAVLHDAEQQYWQSHQVKDWVDSLKDAFYDADDLLDEFSTDVLVKQMMSTGNKMVKEGMPKLTSKQLFIDVDVDN
ncbi:putative disease resistance protein At1g50180 isoform X2 [Hevea brasiliensis]|uniref:putative disease resistance protein At1g50180 isoform X2 n=1 Tax=Hevea brasiliensis TaxID=3981 RepID=UPI0025E1FA5F|nr:putative disease resistance protein At1g50180 isoform X2 [Hevea brasiliensis]